MIDTVWLGHSSQGSERPLCEAVKNNPQYLWRNQDMGAVRFRGMCQGELLSEVELTSHKREAVCAEGAELE